VSSASYFRQQADICRHLSRTCFDLTVAGRLRELADEFTAKAVELDHANEVPAGTLQQATGSNAKINGD
jgi:hypothetical protein